MRIWHSLAAIAATVCMAENAPGQPAPAQQPPQVRTAPAQSPSHVAVIDMTDIFEKYSGFQSRKVALQREIDKAEGELKSMQDVMKNLAEQLKELKPGAPEFKRIEEELAKLNAQAQLKMQLQKKEFLDREAKMFYTTYQEVMDEVKVFCERNLISLVLRFTGEPVDIDDPQQVVKELNKGVVYYNQSIDITQHILRQLERRQPRQPTPTAARQPARPIPRPQ